MDEEMEKVYPESAIEGAEESGEPNDAEKKRKMREAAMLNAQSMMCVYAGPDYFANRKPSGGFFSNGKDIIREEDGGPSMMLVYAAPPFRPRNPMEDVYAGPEMPDPEEPEESPKAEESEPTAYCSQCGAKIPRKVRFCMYCGARNILYEDGKILNC